MAPSASPEIGYGGLTVHAVAARRRALSKGRSDLPRQNLHAGLHQRAPPASLLTSSEPDPAGQIPGRVVRP